MTEIDKLDTLNYVIKTNYEESVTHMQMVLGSTKNGFKELIEPTKNAYEKLRNRTNEVSKNTEEQLQNRIDEVSKYTEDKRDTFVDTFQLETEKTKFDMKEMIENDMKGDAQGGDKRPIHAHVRELEVDDRRGNPGHDREDRPHQGAHE